MSLSDLGKRILLLLMVVVSMWAIVTIDVPSVPLWPRAIAVGSLIVVGLLAFLPWESEEITP